MPIPKELHFIWAGGTKPMPAKNIDCVRQWKERNPEFQVNVWIEAKSVPEEVLKNYRELPPPEGFKGTGIVLKDIHEEGVASPHAEYEINKLRPNYGASSDLIRYSILSKFGGAYFDSDVEPGEKSLNHNGIFDTMDKAMLVNQNSQNIGSLGNDGFICTPNHPLMKELFKNAQQNYLKPFYPGYAHTLYDSEANQNKLDSTVYTTGPGSVTQTFYEAGLLGLTYSDELKRSVAWINKLRVINQTPPQYWIDPQTATPSIENENNWLIPYIRALPLDEAMQAALGAIKFEAEHMGMLRLNDHLDDIISSWQLSEINHALQQNDTEDIVKLINMTEKLSPTSIEFLGKAGVALAKKIPLQETTILALKELIETDELTSAEKIVIGKIIEGKDLDTNDTEIIRPKLSLGKLSLGYNLSYAEKFSLHNKLPLKEGFKEKLAEGMASQLSQSNISWKNVSKAQLVTPYEAFSRFYADVVPLASLDIKSNGEQAVAIYKNMSKNMPPEQAVAMGKRLIESFSLTCEARAEHAHKLITGNAKLSREDIITLNKQVLMDLKNLMACKSSLINYLHQKYPQVMSSEEFVHSLKAITSKSNEFGQFLTERYLPDMLSRADRDLRGNLFVGMMDIPGDSVTLSQQNDIFIGIKDIATLLNEHNHHFNGRFDTDLELVQTNIIKYGLDFIEKYKVETSQLISALKENPKDEKALDVLIKKHADFDKLDRLLSDYTDSITPKHKMYKPTMTVIDKLSSLRETTVSAIDEARKTMQLINNKPPQFH